MLRGVTPLPGMVIGINHRAARSGGTDRRLAAQLHVFLVIFPCDPRGVQLARQMRRGKNISIAGGWVVVSVGTKVRPGLGPDVIGFGRVNAVAGVVIFCRVGGVNGIRLARSHEAVEIGRGAIAKNLLRAGSRIWLGQIVILQRNLEHRANLLHDLNACGPRLRLRHSNNEGQGQRRHSAYSQ